MTSMQLRDILRVDRVANELHHSDFRLYAMCLFPQWQFIKALRKCEYYSSHRQSLLGNLCFLVAARHYRKLSKQLGYSIPIGVCDQGLALPHYGTIVLSPFARLGKNCMVHAGVNIGAREGETGAPQIGDNVYIGPGAKLFGNIVIAEGCYIGANAVITKSVKELGSVILGVPAKVVRIDPVYWWKKAHLNL